MLQHNRQFLLNLLFNRNFFFGQNIPHKNVRFNSFPDATFKLKLEAGRGGRREDEGSEEEKSKTFNGDFRGGRQKKNKKVSYASSSAVCTLTDTAWV